MKFNALNQFDMITDYYPHLVVRKNEQSGETLRVLSDDLKGVEIVPIALNDVEDKKVFGRKASTTPSPESISFDSETGIIDVSDDVVDSLMTELRREVGDAKKINWYSLAFDQNSVGANYTIVVRFSVE